MKPNLQTILFHFMYMNKPW